MGIDRMTTKTKKPMLANALRYAEFGYRVFPCAPGQKTPLTPRGCLDATADAAQVEAWWSKWPTANIGISTDGLLVVDIDGADNPWPGEYRQLDLSLGPVARTPRGGTHHYHKQPARAATQNGGLGWRNTASKLAHKVDTRADGGYVLAPPSMTEDGRCYEWIETMAIDGPPDSLPEPCGWLQEALGETGSTEVASRQREPLAGQGNAIGEGQRNDALARLAGGMRRMGLTVHEIGAALEQVNAARCNPPLPPDEVQRIAQSIGRYDADQITVATVEGHWAQDAAVLAEERRERQVADPGPIPSRLLWCPGFVGELMEYSLATAPYPNIAMSFAGALALQATLAGRKVRDPGDNRTNLYILALAHSASGKDRPRKVNAEILHALGLAGRLGGHFASGEGIQDAMFAEPCMLFQADELDTLLLSITKSKDARHEAIMGTLLTMYSSANSVFPMRRKAGMEAPGCINQPCLVLLGTAVPTHYYQALSERMLTNGFFARMLVIESEKRGSGQEPAAMPVPSRVMEAAAWWRDFQPGGNLGGQNPMPEIVAHTEEARGLLIEARRAAEEEYGRAEDAGDPIGTTVWGRVSENIRKLALCYAISESHEFPAIGAAAVAWARELVMHQTRRMLFMASTRVAESEFELSCKKCIEILRAAPGQEMPHGALLRRMHMDAKNFQALIGTLEQRADVVTKTTVTSTKPRISYALL